MWRAKACRTGAEIPYAFGTCTPKYASFALAFGSASSLSSRSTPALPSFSAALWRRAELERFLGVEEDCDRPFIYQLHRHHGLKNSGRDGDSHSLHRHRKLFVKRLGFFWRSGGDKTGPALPARVSVERELRNDESGAFHVQERPVHF